MIDTSKRFIAGDTVIIFDELQEFPDIATALKSFRIDGRFDVICSGSLLGINYRKIHSNSVGYKTDYEMFSMDFEEFLWAKGYSEKHIEDILKHMKTRTPFSETELSVYKKLFLEYCVLGGMPAVVKVYIEKIFLQILWKSRDRSRWIMKRISENTLKVWIRLKL